MTTERRRKISSGEWKERRSPPPGRDSLTEQEQTDRFQAMSDLWDSDKETARVANIVAPIRLPLDDPRFIELLAWWGTPYSYGAGRPSDVVRWPPATAPTGVHGGRGVDCSGFAQVALVHLGLLAADEHDRSAAALYDLAKPIAVGLEQMGDLAFYGSGGRVSHVMVVVAPGIVMGARGGDQTTNGDNPRAFCQLEPLRYWSLFIGVRRLPVADASTQPIA
ncbi:MAG: NlpC/P60 family protein [Chloroflexota bacterium]